eukprot:6207218-Pleurochrysis_carterae.AAC.3
MQGLGDRLSKQLWRLQIQGSSLCNVVMFSAGCRWRATKKEGSSETVSEEHYKERAHPNLARIAISRAPDYLWPSCASCMLETAVSSWMSPRALSVRAWTYRA